MEPHQLLVPLVEQYAPQAILDVPQCVQLNAIYEAFPDTLAPYDCTGLNALHDMLSGNRVVGVHDLILLPFDRDVQVRVHSVLEAQLKGRRLVVSLPDDHSTFIPGRHALHMALKKYEDQIKEESNIVFLARNFVITNDININAVYLYSAPQVSLLEFLLDFCIFIQNFNYAIHNVSWSEEIKIKNGVRIELLLENQLTEFYHELTRKGMHRNLDIEQDIVRDLDRDAYLVHELNLLRKTLTAERESQVRAVQMELDEANRRCLLYRDEAKDCSDKLAQAQTENVMLQQEKETLSDLVQTLTRKVQANLQLISGGGKKPKLPVTYKHGEQSLLDVTQHNATAREALQEELDKLADIEESLSDSLALNKAKQETANRRLQRVMSLQHLNVEKTQITDSSETSSVTGSDMDAGQSLFKYKDDQPQKYVSLKSKLFRRQPSLKDIVNTKTHLHLFLAYILKHVSLDRLTFIGSDAMENDNLVQMCTNEIVLGITVLYADVRNEKNELIPGPRDAMIYATDHKLAVIVLASLSGNVIFIDADCKSTLESIFIFGSKKIFFSVNAKMVKEAIRKHLGKSIELFDTREAIDWARCSQPEDEFIRRDYGDNDVDDLINNFLLKASNTTDIQREQLANLKRCQQEDVPFTSLVEKIKNKGGPCRQLALEAWAGIACLCVAYLKGECKVHLKNEKANYVIICKDSKTTITNFFSWVLEASDNPASDVEKLSQGYLCAEYLNPMNDLQNLQAVVEGEVWIPASKTLIQLPLLVQDKLALESRAADLHHLVFLEYCMIVRRAVRPNGIAVIPQSSIQELSFGKYNKGGKMNLSKAIKAIGQEQFGAESLEIFFPIMKDSDFFLAYYSSPMDSKKGILTVFSSNMEQNSNICKEIHCHIADAIVLAELGKTWPPLQDFTIQNCPKGDLGDSGIHTLRNLNLLAGNPDVTLGTDRLSQSMIRRARLDIKDQIEKREFQGMEDIQDDD